MEKRKIKALIREALLSEKETLRTWFGRRGAAGKKVAGLIVILVEKIKKQVD